MSAQENLGDRSRRVRAERGLTQQRLAELAKVNSATLSTVECGRRMPNSFTAHRLTAVLDRLENVEPGERREDVRPGQDFTPAQPSNSLRYATSDGGFHEVDGDNWDPSSLSPRERTVCRALLTYALGRLDESEVAS